MFLNMEGATTYLKAQGVISSANMILRRTCIDLDDQAKHGPLMALGSGAA